MYTKFLPTRRRFYSEFLFQKLSRSALPLCGAAALFGATLLPVIASAATINVSINTSTLSGSSANLAFDLTNGDAVVNNTVSLTNFLTDATIGAATLSGGVSGALPGPVTFKDTSFFSELLIPAVLGKSIAFTIDYTNNFAGGVPDNLSFFLFNATATKSLVATNLLGDGLLNIDLNGSPLAATSSNPRIGVSAVPSGPGTVPEPSSILLLGSALALIGLRLKRP